MALETEPVEGSPASGIAVIAADPSSSRTAKGCGSLGNNLGLVGCHAFEVRE